MQYLLQASLALAFIRQRQAKSLFLASLAMGCHRKLKTKEDKEEFSVQLLYIYL
jgi:hypothetical protein